MRSICTACVFVSMTAVAWASDPNLPDNVLNGEAALAQMVKLTTQPKAVSPNDYRMVVNCVVSRADSQTFQIAAPLLTADQRRMLPGETATERSARLQAIVDEQQRVKLKQPLVTRNKHLLSPVYAVANEHFQIVLSEQVVADLKRLGIDNLNDHFAGKSVTVRGTVTWDRWTIDVTTRNFELHVNTLDDIVSVKTADNAPNRSGANIAF